MAGCMARMRAIVLWAVAAMMRNREPVPYGRPFRQGNVGRWWTLNNRPPSPSVATLCGYCSFNGKGSDPTSRSHCFHSMQAISLASRLAGLFCGSLLLLFIGSLASEDQRRFIECRTSGASADACLLSLSGR